MITAHIQPFLVITGLLTALVAVMFVAPRPLLKLMFNVEKPDSITLFVARHWGLLIGLVGMLLIYAAHEPSVRAAAMALAATEKIAGVGLILLMPLKRTTVLWMVVFGDGAMALIYLMYFAGA
jgi:hypothetical protein